MVTRQLRHAGLLVVVFIFSATQVVAIGPQWVSLKVAEGTASVGFCAKSNSEANRSPRSTRTYRVTNLSRLHVVPIIIIFEGEQKEMTMKDIFPNDESSLVV